VTENRIHEKTRRRLCLFLTYFGVLQKVQNMSWHASHCRMQLAQLAFSQKAQGKTSPLV
jgi:hypothetical protein